MNVAKITGANMDAAGLYGSPALSVRKQRKSPASATA
jgi:hypothetical protein